MQNQLDTSVETELFPEHAVAESPPCLRLIVQF